MLGKSNAFPVLCEGRFSGAIGVELLLLLLQADLSRTAVHSLEKLAVHSDLLYMYAFLGYVWIERLKLTLGFSFILVR